MAYPRAHPLRSYICSNSCSPLDGYVLSTPFILTPVLEVGTFITLILMMKILEPKNDDIVSPSECQAGLGRWAFWKLQSVGYDFILGLIPIVTVWALALTPVWSFYLVIYLIPPLTSFLFGDLTGLVTPASTWNTSFILLGFPYVVH